MIALTALKDDIENKRFNYNQIIPCKKIQPIIRKIRAKKFTDIVTNKEFNKEFSIFDAINNKKKEKNVKNVIDLKKKFIDYCEEFKNKKKEIKLYANINALKNSINEDILKKDYINSVKNNIQHFKNNIEYLHEKV